MLRIAFLLIAKNFVRLNWKAQFLFCKDHGSKGQILFISCNLDRNMVSAVQGADLDKRKPNLGNLRLTKEEKSVIFTNRKGVLRRRKR